MKTFWSFCVAGGRGAEGQKIGKSSVNVATSILFSKNAKTQNTIP
jgi:hypothetical protein